MKNFVLDTNVLLYDPQAIFKFEENNIIIPITVIEEVDRFKKDMNETGRNARQVSRYLDDMRKIGSLSSGITLETGGMLRVEMYEEKIMKRLPPELREERGDNRILAVAVKILEENGGAPVVFVTKDTNLRIKADAIGLKAEDYESDKVDIEELYPGFTEIDVAADTVDRFHGQGWVELPGQTFFPNQCVTLRDEANPSHTALGKYRVGDGKITPLIKTGKEGVWSIFPRNREQAFAFDLLLDDSIKLVTLVGKAGTGKTLLAIAAGLHKTAEENVFNRLLVSRPVFPMGRDLGFLPGDIEEKLAPWMQPIFDNVELLLSGHEAEKRHSKGYKELMAMGIMEIEPLTYIRGRSIPNQFMIVDEAQNLTPHEIKTIITRAGEGTKIVLTGDPYQIDNPYVDASSNGLTYVVERFKEQAIAGHVTMTKGERSDLAELAANLL
ncbi:PhoH family protein [Geobacter metallireducens RCH3]|uniref:PhoH-related ATPase n=1 Tax=Geobacter metallireducens (strain ATCC 53774 / DSM 7210 / GS-15) TaxID=269799 RepID=Q39W36_GEOMG|nr:MULTISPECIES: PhoH family protein [Geobacter]ABB31538.1 PhoH-related ATPase [Geobacter metallireducens GS-15]EHP88371.1 PhoH family protein [Geobacter metallireducens RCH3]MBT1075515.1 PhoH family protein [Geobacter grbiciae]